MWFQASTGVADTAADPADQTSNALYQRIGDQRIGYRPIADHAVVEFHEFS